MGYILEVTDQDSILLYGNRPLIYNKTCRKLELFYLQDLQFSFLEDIDNPISKLFKVIEYPKDLKYSDVIIGARNSNIPRQCKIVSEFRCNSSGIHRDELVVTFQTCLYQGKRFVSHPYIQKDLRI
jgi:hypothetical protein